MSSIIKSLGDLAQSLVELVWSFFTTAGHLVQNTLAFGVHSVEGLLNLVLNFFKGLVDLAGGLASFIAGKHTFLQQRRNDLLIANTGNVIILGVIAAAFFGFLQYQRKQGNTVQVGNKKLN